jgi:hypothetical protein
MSGSDRPRVAFYCVSNDRYFLGAVGMLNSLRLVGHREPVVVLDCGLTSEQRELLEPHVSLVPAPSDSLPHLLKTIAPLRDPADVTVLIDADMIVTRPLTDLAERASEGRVVAFRNDYDKFVPEWGELLGLGTARRRPYLCSGLAFLGGSVGREVLSLMHEGGSRVESELRKPEMSIYHGAFWTVDQDVMNAVLCTSVQPDRIDALAYRLAPTPPFRALRLLDANSLRCVYENGTEPYVLHHLGGRMPWLVPMYHGIYSRLLARLLLGPELAVRVPESHVPLRMRDGLLARAERTRVDAWDRLGWYLRERLPRSVMARIDSRRHRRAAAALERRRARGEATGRWVV